MTLYQCVMLWLDINAIVFVGVCSIFGLDGMEAIRQALINLLKRGVYGR